MGNTKKLIGTTHKMSDTKMVKVDKEKAMEIQKIASDISELDDGSELSECGSNVSNTSKIGDRKKRERKQRYKRKWAKRCKIMMIDFRKKNLRKMKKQHWKQMKKSVRQGIQKIKRKRKNCLVF